ncbi:NAD-dependent epimerase/dehydratase family protein [Nesterenkonia sp. HG001]|uniref:NAD-dependent epimerase/dehydratase family protein n=1 Tax=Nesterenkonia sp. HG001 TaxID=2983207 RepID=UPI002AC618E5|nr:NAD-dependent epimerase/dehydratase family protein [Nesterenkonia sp. HG001]MDZ5076368.1 NAD-dependent epimerase/dehydratase family protein [Nesterenkonia sp. HG001]
MTERTASSPLPGPDSERTVIVGAGDLGTRIGRRLRNAGRAVDGWKRDPSTLPEDFTGVSADLTHPAQLPELPEDTTAVVFCPTAGGRTAARYRAVYRDGLRALLERADRLGGRTGKPVRLVLISSTAVHGGESGLVDESTALHPHTATGEVLAETEQLLRSDDAVEATVLRLSGIYGPGRRRLLDQVLGGRLGTGAQGAGAQQRGATPDVDPWRISNRIHVEDAAAAAAAMVTAQHCPSVLLGVDELPVPVGMVHDWLADQLGLPRPWPQLVPADGSLEELLAVGREDLLWRSTRAHGKAVDGTRLRRFLGHLEHRDFRSGYADLVAETAEAE